MRLPSGWLPFSLAAFTVDFTGWHQRRSACTDPSAAVAAIFPQLRQVFLHVRGGNLFVALCSSRYFKNMHSPFIFSIAETQKTFLSSSPAPKRKRLVQNFSIH